MTIIINFKISFYAKFKLSVVEYSVKNFEIIIQNKVLCS